MQSLRSGGVKSIESNVFFKSGKLLTSGIKYTINSNKYPMSLLIGYIIPSIIVYIKPVVEVKIVSKNISILCINPPLFFK